jgi:transcriptional regulator with AAA-type ATPase domain
MGLHMGQAARSRIGEMMASAEGDERRQRALQPFLVAAPKRGIVGGSRYADRLRRQIVTASRDPTRRAAVVFGEPGLNKDNVAALLHFSSPARARPLIEVDASRQDVVADLFGRGSRRGLLSWLGDGAVVVANAHKLPADALPLFARLMTARTYQPLAGAMLSGSVDFAPPEEAFDGRVLLTAEQRLPALEPFATVIQVGW